MGFVVLIFFVAIWTLAWFAPGGPEGPVFRFGLESNTAAFVANTVALIALVFLILLALGPVIEKEEAARKETSINGRLKWYGYTYVRCLVIIGSLAAVFGLYLTGRSSGFPYDIENKIVHWALKSTLTAIFATPLFMWLDAREERRQKSRGDERGLFERVGLRASRYLRDRFRKHPN
jgi:hypothetical protein